MMLIPSIDLKDGRLVQLVGGDPHQPRVTIDDAHGQAERWVRAGASMLHVIDLDAAFGTGSNARVVSEIVRLAGVPVQVGGGVRSTERVEELLAAGASRVLVGTKAILDHDWLKAMVAKHGKRIVIAIDARGGEILVKGWTERTGIAVTDYVRKVDKLGLGAIFFTDVASEGKLTGINEMLVKSLVEAVDKTPVLVAGGISSVDELLMLKEIGVEGAVIGMALYTGRIDFKSALAELSE
ncbi:MAG TPA: 1-(5-phosphoribosyl)-5-[(5-phosphoribosylamino)methylideneamino]imidazole-4-carboxamide isomerase [Candidatus Thermoplasmatota archaeon]|nr:1-(5-phosphoribosyl)-5-[(5-phosphoribosylamino)methylideneamino]imidazole-4-carboxamide isomerase [Candidatus Thermoplasmatota archaeon]